MKDLKEFKKLLEKLILTTPYKYEQQGIKTGYKCLCDAQDAEKNSPDEFVSIEDSEWAYLCGESARLERVKQNAENQLTGLKLVMSQYLLETRFKKPVVETKIKYCPIDQEYRVLLLIDGKSEEKNTYYTDDKEDAEGTAKAMVRDYKGE